MKKPMHVENEFLSRRDKLNWNWGPETVGPCPRRLRSQGEEKKKTSLAEANRAMAMVAS